MREIKFRAWNKHLKRMLQNVGFHPSIIEAHHLDPDAGYSEGEEDYTICPKFKNYILQQFTGLLDKSGREIYEGDIVAGPVKQLINEEDYRSTSVVKWVNTPYTAHFDFGIAPAAPLCEVIGNIYENPDLLN